MECSVDLLRQSEDEDRRTAAETFAPLLAATGRGAPDPETVWQHAENDRGAAAAGWLANEESKAI